MHSFAIKVAYGRSQIVGAMPLRNTTDPANLVGATGKSNCRQTLRPRAAVRDRLDVDLQSRPPEHGLGRIDAKTAAGHGRIASTFGLR
uniref:Uncharacterized protein n=1 Tax=Mycetohabitans sp. TaxID=2571162 RepID=A0A6B9HDT1_9BURK|nr:hypothetical protein [Mycetohabitans sp.]